MLGSLRELHPGEDQEFRFLLLRRQILFGVALRSRGGGRASCRLGWMVLGEVYAITIELFPIANLFCRGQRPRLDISSSNFPHFDVNPNSGEPEGEWQQPRIARNRVFAEAARSSHILLPIIPSGG
jgi:putative CocE/NonD family hydrolase